jgi:mannose-6-phosphate isomerase-like protein (cupin superfamily)
MGAVKPPADWKPHPRFAGVSLKALITAETNSGIAVNLVRLQPGGEITPHVHSTSTETFYILRGHGLSWIGEEQLALEPGVCAYAPPQVMHSVCNTGDTELEALSIFNPPV